MAPQEQRPKDRVIKPKNARAKRALLARAPRQVETLKKALLMHSGKTSGVLKALLGDLGALKAGESLKLSRKNAGVRPFEGGGEASLEFLARKADCSLFALGSHSKKRPHNLVLGRLFDFRLLDMVEFGVRICRANSCPEQRHGPAAAAAATLNAAALRCLTHFRGRLRTTRPSATLAPWRRRARAAPSPAWSSAETASRPTRCVARPALSQPPPAHSRPSTQTLRTAKSLLLDFFRGRVVPNINLRGLDRAIICTAVGQRILFRQCAIRYKKSGSKVRNCRFGGRSIATR
jgi:hypothetical protein